MSVMEDGSANFDLCATLLRFNKRLAFRSSRLSLRFMARLPKSTHLMIANNRNNTVVRN